MNISFKKNVKVRWAVVRLVRQERGDDRAVWVSADTVVLGGGKGMKPNAQDQS